MENYPIIIKNETAGQLSVYSEGAKTFFTADCKMQDGIIRLSVFGEGKVGYLGVLVPKGDRLYLRKSFSRSEMKDFPQKIEYAAPITKRREKSERKRVRMKFCGKNPAMAHCTSWTVREVLWHCRATTNAWLGKGTS